jgi:hypothetical protein
MICSSIRAAKAALALGAAQIPCCPSSRQPLSSVHRDTFTRSACPCAACIRRHAWHLAYPLMILPRHSVLSIVTAQREKNDSPTPLHSALRSPSRSRHRPPKRGRWRNLSLPSRLPLPTPHARARPTCPMRRAVPTSLPSVPLLRLQAAGVSAGGSRQAEGRARRRTSSAPPSSPSEYPSRALPLPPFLALLPPSSSIPRILLSLPVAICLPPFLPQKETGPLVEVHQGWCVWRVGGVLARPIISGRD